MTQFWNLLNPFPGQHSTFASNVDAIFYFIFWLSMFFFVAIVGFMIYFMIKYRRVEGQEPESSPSHNTPIEVAWSVIPGFLVLGIFWWGFTGYVDMRSPPAEAYEVNVIASMWQWQFKYPTGAISDKLHIPVNRPVKLIMQSKDVLHSLYVPSFRAKQDVVPGRYSGMWFEATDVGVYDLFCTEYCGQKHSDMITKVVVHSTSPEGTTEEVNQTFERWMEIASNPLNDEQGQPLPLDVAGKKLVDTFQCAQCHSIDGTKKVGPSFKGNYGKEVEIVGQGKVLMDENYIRESILEPTAKIHVGYEPKMPSFKGQMKDEWIDAVIAYIKSIQ
ncbi:cytochrome c oxidase subunit II [Rubinisphaera sp.]|uniref:cytochrome c oxidase subunit II n=1 Tax=Rubinisphaera sp. TaxID=2024857 RepID=UPI000C1132D5|nr:cytochrome c oxidase subunit II [Rubinisphaera sp.]MBV11275.1 cytochrome c oxidase subunit II [Rubinisphaera sp.]HCS53544.1 cytochrome c oxidase subunit II [Planctomycetaceae bacterium]|tara:strand:+ start:11041 stop:12030 length:990 start_codon:yes stop_codon:yes gene_type:complete